jgi:hypothetical protein
MIRKEIQNGIQVKAEGGTLTGYASTFNNVDKAKEIVLPGAFSESVKAFKAGKVRIPLLDAHRVFGSTEAVIGKIVELKEDAVGLKFKAELSETPLAQQVRKKVAEGLLDSLSIGYSIDADEVRRDGIRILKKLTLREISVVVFPANPEAKITGIKGENVVLAAKARLSQLSRMDADLRFVEERLDDLDRKQRMIEMIERLQGEELSPEQCGWII